MPKSNTSWYRAVSDAKHVRQVVVQLPAKAKTKPCVDNLTCTDINLIGPANWSAGLVFVDNRGPFVFAKANGPMEQGGTDRVVDQLGDFGARIVFAFYHFDSDGVFQVFVEMDAPVVRHKMGYPYLAERVLSLSEADNREVILATLRRSELELCVVADGQYGPLTGHHGLKVDMPSELRDALESEWRELNKHRDRLGPTEFDRALAQYNRENPMWESPILDAPAAPVQPAKENNSSAAPPPPPQSPLSPETSAGEATPPTAGESRTGFDWGVVGRGVLVLLCTVALGWLAWGQEAPPEIAWAQPVLDSIQQAFDDVALGPQFGRALVGAGAGALLGFLLVGRPWRLRRLLLMLVLLGAGAITGWQISQGSCAAWFTREFRVSGLAPTILVCAAVASLVLGLWATIAVPPAKSAAPSGTPGNGATLFRRIFVPLFMSAAGWLAWGEEAPSGMEWFQPVLDLIQNGFAALPLEPPWARRLVGAGAGGLTSFLLGGGLWRPKRCGAMLLLLGLGAGAAWSSNAYFADHLSEQVGLEGLTPLLVVAAAGVGVLLGLYEWLRRPNAPAAAAPAAEPRTVVIIIRGS